MSEQVKLTRCVQGPIIAFHDGYGVELYAFGEYNELLVLAAHGTNGEKVFGHWWSPDLPVSYEDAIRKGEAVLNLWIKQGKVTAESGVEA
jgi:hypothetical protein